MRIVTLSVMTEDEKGAYHVFNDLSEMANKYSASHRYGVSVSSHLDEDISAEETNKSLRLNSRTMDKVRDPLRGFGISEDGINDLINEMQNSGIVFCERSEN